MMEQLLSTALVGMRSTTQLLAASWPATLFTALVGWIIGGYLYRSIRRPNPSEPPMVNYWIPFIGSMVSFGMNPVQFLQKNREIYGDYYTFLMFGRRMTYCLGVDGNNAFFNARLADANAEEAYASLTVPVFGEGVVYDVPNHMLMDQKRFAKGGLTADAFRLYVPIIVKEVEDYFARWHEPSGVGNIHEAMAQCIVNTATHCLMGREIRAMMDDTVAQLYEDMDKGFTPLNFLFPSLPLPAYRRRDRAHAKMSALFQSIIDARRASTDAPPDDMMTALMNSHYKDGRRMSDKEVGNLMIALLMAGQHTSSATTTWAILYLADRPALVEALREEQRKCLGDDLATPIAYEHLRDMRLLDAVVRETLRLRPPIVTAMRKVMRPMTVAGGKYVVPAGHYLGSSPALTQLDPTYFKEPLQFEPTRWLDNNSATADEEETAGDQVDYGFGTIKLSGARNPYLPFGAGRHRCIGESFAYVQIKTILATMLRLFDLAPGPKGFPEMDFTSLVVLPAKPAQITYRRRQ
ncbi:lanosterol 14-alpha demethylase [Syncephalis pseudoplumigaleata]|uniref:Lanosterol 14-alpha demethylase n=1 Tax=Syncephalis pseudoplumigaleata TaxID=1712513 RepID=A0A4P9Z479_9FUNG|nr:lanosterol 14-alpha demethylase [Syncephalis pseudoplumigaleata]|eukprot:RKP27255.1 lanosterol 14-alpha demethylase [Syncephalis pseudoplumigaleata]